jgi:hypothetical protein
MWPLGGAWQAMLVHGRVVVVAGVLDPSFSHRLSYQAE